MLNPLASVRPRWRNDRPRRASAAALLVSMSLAALSLITGIGARAALAAPAGERPPNIVMILPDAWRGAALGLGGFPDGDPNLRDPETGESLTPNLDRIASEGVRFRNCSAVYPLCGPGRAALLTGRYPHRDGLGKNGRMLRRTATGIAEVTRDAGYATAYVGKWHLNTGLELEKAIGDGYVAPGGNRRHGFDLMIGTNYGHRHRGFHYFRNAPRKQFPRDEEAYEPTFQTNVAMEFVTRNRARPFHLVLSYGPPHEPHSEAFVPPQHWARIDEDRLVPTPNVPSFDTPGRWYHDPCRDGNDVEACWREFMHGYYASIVYLDTQIGRLIERLEQEGLYDDTIFVLTSDHGEMGGSHGLYSKGNPMVESTSIPFLVSWPAGLGLDGADRVRDELVASVDIPVTLLGLLGLEFPDAVDGRDFAPLLTGDGPAPELEGGGILTYGRLVERGFRAWRALRTDHWLYAYSPNTENAFGLWNLAVDPYQQVNLVNQGHAMQERLHKLLVERRRQVGEDLPHCEFPPDTTRDIDPLDWFEHEEGDGRLPLAFVPAILADGTNARHHRIYFGDDVPVDDRSWDRVFELRDQNWMRLGPRMLRAGGTYFWKIEVVDETAATPRQTRVFTFSIRNAGAHPDLPGEGYPGVTSEPSPASGSVEPPGRTKLIWEGASGAASYVVRFGTTNPPPPVTEQARTIYSAPTEPGTTYYWRIDARNAKGIAPGPTWSFRTAK